MFRLTLLSVVASVASSTEFIRKPSSALSTTSRRLEDADDFSWMSGYTVAYENCFYTDDTVAFLLCPEDNSCQKGCDGGGEYLVDLKFFVDAFTEAQMDAREYICEQVRENCDNDDEDTCYENAGLNYCGEEDEDEFNVQEYLECNQFDDDYYVGPYCAGDSYSIYLGYFTDEDCTEHAADGTFYNTYGYDLPYSDESIITDECARCREHAMDEHENYGDQEDEDDVLEQCEELYQEATKCESGMNVDYADEDGCSYIEELKETEQVSSQGSSSGGSSRRSLIWGLVIAALAIGAMVGCWVCYRKKRNEAELSPAKENLI